MQGDHPESEAPGEAGSDDARKDYGQGFSWNEDDAGSLEDVVEAAFDYRGDVTVAKVDGSQVVGYLYNRNGKTAEPFIQLLRTPKRGATAATELLTIPYRDIRNIGFSGKDTAAGQSYAAWKRRKPNTRQPNGPTERAAS